MNYAEALAYLDTFINFERLGMTRGARAVIYAGARAPRLACGWAIRKSGLRACTSQARKAKAQPARSRNLFCARPALKTGLYTSPHLQDVRERIQSLERDDPRS